MDVPVDHVSGAFTVTRRDAFDAFVEAHRDRAVRLAWRLVDGDDALAEDVAQDAFLRAHRGLEGFRDEAALATWFYRIVVRQALNARRRRATAARWLGWLGHDAVAAPRHGDPMLRDALVEAIGRLSEGQRTAFTLVHLEEMTVVEASAVMGCAVGTTKSHLHRALTALRQELEQERSDEG